MKKIGMPESSIVNKMRMDGLTASDIEQWKNRMFIRFCFFESHANPKQKTN